MKEEGIDKGNGLGGRKCEHSQDQSELLKPPLTPGIVNNYSPR